MQGLQAFRVQISVDPTNLVQDKIPAKPKADPVHLRRAAGFQCSTSCVQDQTDLRFYHAAVTEPLVRDLIVVEVSSPTAKKGSCEIIQLFSRPKVSKSHCMISQEPFLQRW